MKLRTLIASGLLILGGCSEGTPESAVSSPSPAVAAPEANPSANEAPEPPDTTVAEAAPTAGSLEAFALPSNALGFDLFTRAGADDAEANLALSPASITLAFDMLQGGARGETLAEMNRTMHLEGSETSVHDNAQAALRALTSDGDGHELKLANRLFGEQSAEFEDDYLALTRERYGAELAPMNFGGAPDDARATINAWVGEQTAGRITDLLPPLSVDENTRLVLVNTLYFLGKWASAFDPAQTTDAAFTVAGGESVEVPTMHRSGTISYARQEGVTLVELAYQDSELAMTLMLPDAADGLPELEGRLDPASFARWVDSLRPERVQLALPRFELRSRSTLSRDLRALGMQSVFSAVGDFTGISDPADPADRLHVTEAYHQVFVKVEEEGTEAAAATAIAMGRGAGRPPQSTIVSFDRPFLFAIRDRSSGLILFLGRVADPR